MNTYYYSSNAIAQESSDSQSLRVYTYTIKPTYMPYKLAGFKCLWAAFLDQLKNMKYNSFQYVVEDEGTINMHIHAMIECPYITDKKKISLFGWHTHLDLIRKGTSEEDIKIIWLNYINKQFSDSDKFYNLYGNCFK